MIEDKGQLTLVAPDLAMLGEYAARFSAFQVFRSGFLSEKHQAGELTVWWEKW